MLYIWTTIIWSINKTSFLCTILELEKSFKLSAMFCRAANWASICDRWEENQTVGGTDEAPGGPTIWVFVAPHIREPCESFILSSGLTSSVSPVGSMWLSDGVSSRISRVYRHTFHHRVVCIYCEHMATLHSIWRPAWVVRFRRSCGTLMMGCGSRAAFLITEVASKWSWALAGEEGFMEGISDAPGLRRGWKSWWRASCSKSKTLMNWRPFRSWETKKCKFYKTNGLPLVPVRISRVVPLSFLVCVGSLHGSQKLVLDWGNCTHMHNN